MQDFNIPMTRVGEMDFRGADKKLKKHYCKTCTLIPLAYRLGPDPLKRRTRGYDEIVFFSAD
jgi:hypothetical protein